MPIAAPSDPTLRADLNDVFNTEFITQMWRQDARDPLTGLQLVKVVPLDLAGSNSLTYQIPVENEMTGVTSVSQPNEAPEADLTTGQVQITGARYALRGYIADDVRSRVFPAMMRVAAGLQHAVRNYLHQQILTLFTSISSSQGDNATENNISNWETATQAHRALILDPGPRWAVLHSDAVRDLRQDLATGATALFGSGWGERAADAIKTPQSGLGVPFDGYTVHEGYGDVPAGDTTGWTNALGVGGENAGIELVMWQDLLPAFERNESSFGTWLIASVIAGWGIAKQTNLHAFITQT